MKTLKGLATAAALALWSFSALATPIYTITESGDMLSYKHTGMADGSPNWPVQGRKIGNGWNFRQVFAGESERLQLVSDGETGVGTV